MTKRKKEKKKEEIKNIKQEEKKLKNKLNEELNNLDKEELNNEDLTKSSEEKISSPCEDKLLKLQADFENFKARTQREKNDMIFFLKQDILLKVLPRLDDLDRILNNTPKDLKETSLFEGIKVLKEKFTNDLEKMGVKPFLSCGETVDPEKHEVMTIIPGKEKNIICDEFEKGYTLDGKILRHAKVIAGAGE